MINLCAFFLSIYIKLTLRTPKVFKRMGYLHDFLRKHILRNSRKNYTEHIFIHNCCQIKLTQSHNTINACKFQSMVTYSLYLNYKEFVWIESYYEPEIRAICLGFICSDLNHRTLAPYQQKCIGHHWDLNVSPTN